MTAFYILLFLIPMVLGFWAQSRVQSAYTRWSRVYSRRGMTGAQAAREVMRAAGIDDIEIVEIPGTLTDHYDPRHRRLALSTANYRGSSLAALGVAAHEAGHAIQDKVHYPALRLRMSLIPLTAVASNLIYIVIAIAVFIPALFPKAALAMVVIFLILTLFQLVTLPVEYDASARAKAQLVSLGIIDSDEMKGVSDTLSAAALTYVAAFVSSLLTLLYWFLQSRR